MQPKNVLAVALGTLLTILVVTVQAQAPVVSPDGQVFGKDYKEWAGEWLEWQWKIPSPEDRPTVHPFNDTTGDSCSNGQRGQVWFLTGDPTFGEPGVTRSCTVPVGVPILVTPINGGCSTLEDPPFFGENEEDLKECVTDLGFSNEDTVNVTLTIGDRDSFQVENARDFLVDSMVVSVVAPDENFAGVDTSSKGNWGKAAVAGYFLMIAPLPPGNHEIAFEAIKGEEPFTGFTQKVTYRITVPGGGDNDD